jgi:class 3 adenylate cyclase
MFTDIAGYSRLMDEDEERTIEVLSEHNRIVLPLLSDHGGELIDSVGDGLLVIFPSVLDALECARTIHNAVAAHNRQIESRLHFLLRIGIHLGDIWREEGRIFGSGVNIAARIQQLAKPGGISLTDDVYRQVSNKTKVEVDDLGSQQLHNISRPVHVYQLRTGHEQEPAAEKHRADDDSREEYSFDHIKQELLRKRAEGRKTEDAFAESIKSKVFGLVEKAMDTAVDKWESMPEEKKQRAVQAVRDHIQGANGDPSIRAEKPENEKQGDSDDNASTLTVGAVFGLGFGLGYFLWGISWMIVPFFLVGLLPFSVGLVKSLRRLVRRSRERRRKPQALEQQVLHSANKLGGRVTVVQVASQTGLGLDEVQAALDRMTRKGYVVQEVNDNGVITYEFPSV